MCIRDRNSWGILWGDRGFMKISMKKDFCGVLSNGPLMVSVGGWSNETTYPFQSMKKVVSTDGNKFTVSSSDHYSFSKDHIETEADFFVIPDHVTAYFNGSPNNLDFL